MVDVDDRQLALVQKPNQWATFSGSAEDNKN
jgi:hypothetical protein